MLMQERADGDAIAFWIFLLSCCVPTPQTIATLLHLVPKATVSWSNQHCSRGMGEGHVCQWRARAGSMQGGWGMQCMQIRAFIISPQRRFCRCLGRGMRATTPALSEAQIAARTRGKGPVSLLGTGAVAAGSAMCSSMQRSFARLGHTWGLPDLSPSLCLLGHSRHSSGFGAGLGAFGAN